MKLLLHICCGPCSSATVEVWRQEGVEVTGTFFNPNIHPYNEHQRRYETLMEYASAIELPLIGEPHYNIKEWLKQVAGSEEHGVRCRICIAQRLRHTARLAAEGGFDAFSTTLSISRYQDHDLIIEEGRKAGEEFGVGFIYRDLTHHYHRSVELSREAGLFRQNYCGCIYSEEEAAREREERKRKKKDAKRKKKDAP